MVNPDTFDDLILPNNIATAKEKHIICISQLNCFLLHKFCSLILVFQWNLLVSDFLKLNFLP